MFNFVKTRKRVIQVILVLIIVPFAFFGLESYTRSMLGGGDVAKVDGLSITQREFEDELRRQQDRFRQLFGRDVDFAQFDTRESRLALLDSMIGQKLVGSAALNANMVVTDQTLRAVIAATPAFQNDGRFSMPNYEAVVRQQGMTTAGYEALLRQELTARQLIRAVADSAIAPRAVAERLARIEEEGREVAAATVPGDAYLAQVKVDEGELRRYYDAQAAEFRTPERLRAEYVVLSAAGLGANEQPTEAEIKAAYEARAGRLQNEEQRRASHILIQAGSETSEEARKAARAKIERILAEVKKSPGRFADLAKKHSEDPGSAENGGDLGFFGRGMMVPPFEEAVFAMKEGETSSVVPTEYGYHIIRVTGIKGPRTQTLEEVRAELVAELQRQKGMRRFNEAAEAFSNMVYEQPDSLKPAAEQFRLQVRTTGWLTKTAGAKQDPLINRKLLDALFSSDALVNKRNTDAIEVAPNTLVAARVTEHQPSVQRPFDEVRGEIERTLRAREAGKLAHKEGAAKLAQLEKGGDAGLKWGASRVISRRNPQGFAPETVRRILAADASRLPAYVGIERGDEGYAIFRISKVIEPPAKTPEQKAADLARTERQTGLAQYEAFVASLRKRADVAIYENNLANQQ